jgi:hypothetical protein
MMWGALKNATAGCIRECSYVLATGFTTPLTGFQSIGIGLNKNFDDDKGQDPVHISIDGKGMAVIDARGKCERVAVACMTRGGSMLTPVLLLLLPSPSSSSLLSSSSSSFRPRWHV